MTEGELIGHLPAFPPRGLTREQLDKLTETIRRHLDCEGIPLNSEKGKTRGESQSQQE